MQAMTWLMTMKKNSEIPSDDFLDLYPLRTNLKEVECKSVGRKFHFLHSLNPEIFKFKFEAADEHEKVMKPRSEFISQCNLKLLQRFHLLLLEYLQWLRLLTLRVKTKTLRITKAPLLLYIKDRFCYYTPTTSY